MLVDTSIWVEHLRHRQLGLVSLLHRAEVQCHPFIIGELACGSIKHRSEILQLLRRSRCSFEAILEDYALADPALQKLRRLHKYSRGYRCTLLRACYNRRSQV